MLTMNAKYENICFKNNKKFKLQNSFFLHRCSKTLRIFVGEVYAGSIFKWKLLHASKKFCFPSASLEPKQFIGVKTTKKTYPDFWLSNNDLKILI